MDKRNNKKVNKKPNTRVSNVKKKTPVKKTNVKKTVMKAKTSSINENFSRTIGVKSILYIVLVVGMLIILVGRIAYLQFVEGEWLKEKKYAQTTASTTVAAKRGSIFDANGKALAISADVDTISVNPKLFKAKVREGKSEEESNKELKEELATQCATIFGLDREEVLAKLTSDNSIEVIARKVETTKVAELRKWIKDNKVYAGINIDSDIKRYYPYDNLASNLLGFVGTSGQGLEGVELSYDSVLSGKNGRRTTSISGSQSAIPDQNEEYIAPENGSNLYLTIDSNIQTIAEKYLKQAVEENNCEKGGNVIIMDPSTGEIKAMATYPDYNLNDPYVPNSMIDDGWDELETQEKTNRLYQMWRNKAVVDTYEPGSTFKTLVASIALEENLVTTDEPGDFYCSGAEHVADYDIRCTALWGHGSQTLRDAIENSCNPAFIQLGQRIGRSNYYKYFKAYGLFDNTGIDLPSEGESTFWAESNVGPVELATMSFGQRFTITPMQLVKAVSAIANDGVIVTPHVVKEIENTDTGNKTTIETVEERQVISKETAEKMKNLMQDVVEEGGGKYAKVKGYTIGGKTGTSEPDPGHPENGYVASFLAIAPVENTKLTVLLTLYKPTGGNYYGGSIAAPAVAQILSEVLPYMDIPSNDTSTIDSIETIGVPDLTGKTLAEAESTLSGMGLAYSAVGEADQIVSMQMPLSGSQLTSEGIVKLYTEGNTEKVKTTVPDLKGVSLGQATIMLRSKNLNIASDGSGIVISQDPKAGTEVDEGSMINVNLQEATDSSQH